MNSYGYGSHARPSSLDLHRRANIRSAAQNLVQYQNAAATNPTQAQAYYGMYRDTRGALRSGSNTGHQRGRVDQRISHVANSINRSNNATRLANSVYPNRLGAAQHNVRYPVGTANVSSGYNFGPNNQVISTSTYGL